jgi:NAD(P)H-nitrite reductase large subunit
MSDETIICNCLDITKGDILAAIKEKNLKTVEEITEATEAGSACGGCLDDIQEILDELN